MNAELQTSRQVISRAITRFENLAVFWAGDRDSTLLLHLARQETLRMNDPLDEVFTIEYLDAGNEARDEVMKEVTMEWEVDQNLNPVNPGANDGGINRAVEEEGYDAILLPNRWTGEEKGLRYFRDLENKSYTEVYPLLHLSSSLIMQELDKLSIDGENAWKEPEDQDVSSGGGSEEDVAERLSDLGYL